MKRIYKNLVLPKLFIQKACQKYWDKRENLRGSPGLESFTLALLVHFALMTEHTTIAVLFGQES